MNESLVKVIGIILAVGICSWGREDLCDKHDKVARISLLVIIGNIWFVVGLAIILLLPDLKLLRENFDSFYSATILGLALSAPAGMYSWSVFLGQKKDIRFPWSNYTFYAAFLMSSPLIGVPLLFASEDLTFVAVAIATVLHALNFIFLNKYAKTVTTISNGTIKVNL